MEKNFCDLTDDEKEKRIEELEFDLEHLQKMKDQVDRSVDLYIKAVSEREEALKFKDLEIKRLNDKIKEHGII